MTKLKAATGLLSLIFVLFSFSCDDDSTDNGTGSGTGTGTGTSTGTGSSINLVINVDGLSNTCSIYNLDNGNSSKEAWQTGDAPNDLTAYNDKAYIISSMSNSLQIVDLKTNKVIKTVNLGGNTNPYYIISDEDGNFYISMWLSNEVCMTNENGDIIRRIPVDKTPQGLALEVNKLFVSCISYDMSTYSYGQGYLDIFDASTFSLVKKLETPVNPSDIATDGNRRIFLMCSGDYVSNFGKVLFVDANSGSIEKTIDIGGSPGVIVYDGSGKIYLADMMGDGDGAIYVINSNTGDIINGTSNPLKPCTQPMGLAFDIDTSTLFVSSFDKNKIFLVNPSSGNSDRNYSTGEGPQAIFVYRSSKAGKAFFRKNRI